MKTQRNPDGGRRETNQQARNARFFVAYPIAAIVFASMTFAVPVCAQSANTLPTNGQITSGTGSISQSGNQLTVTQNTDHMIAQWGTFNIGQNASVQFNQPGTSSVALNRIQDQNPSQILGSLSANGQVFLINPSGLYFGKNATVNVGSLVASSLDIANADFQADKYKFAGRAGSVVNDGAITAVKGGIVALISPVVSNDGTITAQGGVALAAGSKVNLNFGGDGLINLTVDEAAVDAQVSNKGLIRSVGGMVIMTARAADELVGAVVNNSGIIEANTLSNVNGRIILDGGDLGVVENTGTLSASGVNAGESGGVITVTGEKVALSDHSVLDASGQAGGGTILIGGGFHGDDASVHNANQTFVGPDAIIRADGGQTGNGGQVVVWSNEATRFYGNLSARGGVLSGNGGRLEISSKGLLGLSGQIDAGAKNGAAGSLLLDPRDITVVSGAGAILTAIDQFADTPSTDLTVDPNTITAATNLGTAVTLQANNDIFLNSSIVSINGGGNGGDLTFRAGRSITLNGAVISDNGNVAFTVNDSGATADRLAGAASFTNNGLVDAGSRDVTITMGTKSTSGSIYSGQVSANNFTISHAGTNASTITLGETDVATNMVIAATGTAQTVGQLTGTAVIVRGIASIKTNGGNITLAESNDDFNSFAANAVDVTINDANGLQLGDASGVHGGASAITGNLTVTTKGPIGNTGVVNVSGATTLTPNNGGFGVTPSDVTLNSYTNNFNTFEVTQGSSGNSVYVSDANGISLKGLFRNYLSVTAAGPITEFGAMTVGGTGYFAAGAANDITLNTQTNLFGAVQFGSGKNITVSDSNGGLRLYASTVSGNLDLAVSGTGGFYLDYGDTTTVTGAMTVNVASGLFDAEQSSRLTAGSLSVTTSGSFQTDYDADITANSGDLSINAGGAVTFGTGYYSDVTVSAGNMSVVSGGAVNFGRLNNVLVTKTAAPAGNLSIQSFGDITQDLSNFNEARIQVAGNTAFTVTKAGSSVNLQQNNNKFDGSVALNTSGAGSYTNVYLRNISANAGTITGLGGSLSNVTLYYDNALSLTVPGMTLSGNLDVRAPSGSIGQAAALTVAGSTIMAASSSSDIIMNNAANNFYQFGIANTGARDLVLVDVNAVVLYAPGYHQGVTRNYSVTAGGNISDVQYNLSVPGTATFNAGANNITLTGINAYLNILAIPAANNVTILPQNSVVLDNIAITGSLSLQSRGGGTLTQLASTSVVTGAPSTNTTSFTSFNSGITLANTGNILGNLAISDAADVNIRENDAITQASAWGFNGTNGGTNSTRRAVTLTTSNDQAITLDQAGSAFGNLTITQVNTGAGSAGAVYVRETGDSYFGMTEGSAWTVHGTTRIDGGAYSVALTNTNNVFGPLQVAGATGLTNGAASSVTIYAKNTATTDAITDVSSTGAWATGTGTVKLVAYDVTGTTAGAGNIILTNAGNVLGDLYIKGANVTITENDNITDGVSAVWFGSDTGWVTTGNTSFVVANPIGKSITLDNLGNQLGPIGITTTGTAGTLSGVTITDNTNLTQSSVWTVGTAPVTLDARNHAIDLGTYSNVLGNVAISTTNGMPTSVSIREDDPITQGSNPWIISGVPVTLYAENNKAVTLTQATNVLGNLTVTGGVVSITENDAITQGGAWATTGTTTLNSGTNAITLTNTGNVLGGLAFGSTPSAISITENDDITQAGAWSLATVPTTLNSQTHDVLLSQSANQLGNLALTGANATVVENDAAGITQAAAWTVSGTTALTAGSANPITLTTAGNNFGTVVVTSASAADITDSGAVIFGTSSVTGTLTISAGGEITQSGALTANSLLLKGTGYATLTNPSNNVVNLAAGFSGGNLNYTDTDNFAVAIVGGTSGITIGANAVTLTSVNGTISTLTNINATTTSLAVSTGTALNLPQMTVAGPQTYTASTVSGTGITLTGNVTSNASGAITFNSPVTLSNDWVIQSTNSNINFLSTLTGANNQLTVNAGSGQIDFAGAVSGMGATTDAAVALTVSSGGTGTTFHSTLAANNGLSVTGPVVFMDNVTLANGLVGSTFGGQVTLGKVGGMNLSGYDNFSFNGGVVLQSGAATVTSNNSTMTFAGVNTIHGPFGLVLDAGTQIITGVDHVGTDITSLVVTANTPTIPGAGISIAGPQTYNATSGTSVTLSGPVTSTASGTILFNSPVVLGSDATIASTNSAITFASTVDGAHDLTLSSGSGIKTFTGKVGNISAVGDGAGASITLQGSGSTIFSNTVATRSGIVAAGPVTFGGNVTAANGDTGSTFNGLVTSGGVTLSGYDNLAFNAGLVLTGDLSILANGSTLGFSAAVSGPHDLTLNALAAGAGTVTGLDYIGTDLTSLTVTSQTLSLPTGTLAVSGPMSFTAAGGITLNGNVGSASSPATGQIDFNSPVSLATGAISIATANAPINFLSTVNGAKTLSVDAGTSTTTFSGIVGGTTPLTGLTTSGLIALNGTAVTTSGAQLYNNAVTLGASATLTGSAVTFGGTLNGGYTLLANVSGATTFNGIVGGVTPLTSITTDAPGSVILNSSAISTTGTQVYNELITLGADITLNGANLRLLGGASGAQSLTLSDAGTTTLGPLNIGALAVTANSILLGGNVTTTAGGVSVTGPATLTANVSISTSAGGGNITFSGATSTINGAHDLTLAAGSGNVVLGGLVGGITPVGIVDISGNNLTIPVINSTGTQTYSALNNLTLSQSRTSSVPLIFNADSDGNGSGSFILPTGVTLVTTNQSLTINAADLDLQGSSTINTGSGPITFAPTNARNLFLGGTDATAMSISASELSRISTSGGIDFLTTGFGWIKVAGIAGSDSQNISGELHLDAQGSGDVSFVTGPSTFNALKVQTGSGTINLAQNLTTTNDPVIFASPVATTGTVTVNSSGGSIDVQDTFAANNPVTFTTGGGALTLGGNVTGTSTVTVTLAGGTVSGLDRLQPTLTGLTLNNNASVTLPSISINGPHTYNGPVSVTGNLTGVGLAFNSTVLVSANNQTLNSGTGTMAFASTITAGTNSFTLTGDEVNFGAAVTGTGNLTLQPSTGNVGVIIGGSASTANLDLTATDLSWLPSNLASLTIGQTTGTGTIAIGAATNLGTVPTTLNGLGGISQSGALASGGLTLNSNNSIDLSNTSNSLGAISISGAPSAVAISDSTSITQGAAWNLGTAPVALNAGSNAITLTQASNTFGDLALTGGTVLINENADTTLATSNVGALTVNSTGAISTTGTVAVTGVATFKTLNDAGKSVTLDHNSTFGSLYVFTRNAADTADVAGGIALSPAASTTLKTLQTLGNIAITAPLGSTISQDGSSVISSAGLELLGTGNYDLSSGTNTITTLAGNAGNISFGSAGGYAIGTVNAAGLTSSGNVTLSTGGSVTQSQPIVAGGLRLLGTGSSYTLFDAGNNISTLAGSVSSLSFRDDNGFAIGTVTTAGLTATGNVTLFTTGTVTQSQAFTGSGLELLGAGSTYTLNNSSNNITTLAGNVGSVWIIDNTGFTVGSVNTTGLTASNSAVFSTTSTVGQTQDITAAKLGLLGVGGAFTLTGTNNSIGIFAADTGSLNLHNNGALVIGSVNPVGITTTGDVTIVSNGALTQTQALNIGGNLSVTTTHNAGNVTIDNSAAPATVTGNSLIGGDYLLTATGQNVSQSPGSYLQVAGDLTINSGSATLDGAGNLVRGTTLMPGNNSTLRQSGVITLGNINTADNYTVISEAASRNFASGPIGGTAVDLSNPLNHVTGSISVTTTAPNIVSGPQGQTGILQQGGTAITITGNASFTAESSSAGSLGVILTNTGNTFGSIRATGNLIDIRDSSSTSIVAGFNGSTGTNLVATGPVTQTGAVITPTFTVSSTGAITLTNSSNQVSTLSLTGAGALAYDDADGFVIAGINANNHSLSLVAGGTGTITQTGAVQNVTALSLNSGGATTFTDVGNTLDSLATVSSGGALQISDSTGGLSVTGTAQALTGDVTIRTVGDLSLGASSAVTATAGNIYVSTEGAGNFTNSAGAGVFTVGSGSRWLVYSKTPDLVGAIHTVKGGLTSSFRLYGKTYGTDAPAGISATGNGFIYADSPAVTLTISPTIIGTASHVYGDTPTASLGYTVSGGLVDSEDNAANIDISGTALFDHTLANTMNVGLYSIKYTSGLTSSYTLVADTNGVAYNVTRAPLLYVATTDARNYGDNNPSLGGTVTGFRLTDSVSDLGGTVSWTTTAAPTSNVGGYAITGGGYTSGNYSFSQAAGNATALSVTARPITLTADNLSRIYGNANPTNGTFTVTSGNLVNGDLLAATVSVSSPATLTSNVGGYALNSSGVVFSNGASTNYSVSYAPGNLTVAARPITLTANNQSRYYGNANPTTGSFAISSGNLVNSDALNASLAVTSPTTLADHVGSYALTPSGATFTTGSASNYAVSYADGSLAVTARPITLTAINQNRIYGDANPTSGSFIIGGSGLGNSDALASLLAVTSPAVATSNVGGYSLTPSSAVFTNGLVSDYAITYADGSLAVTARPITVTPNDQSRFYGNANPTSGTYTITSGSLVNSDALASSVSVSSPATLTSHVSNYALGSGAVSFTSGLASNYAIAYSPGTLSVTPRPITLTASNQNRVYGEANPTSGTYIVGGNGLANADTLNPRLTVSSPASATSDVGSYALTPNNVLFTSGAATDYAVTYADGSLTLTTRPITVTLDNQSRIYGDANPTSGTFAVSGSGLVNTDALNANIAVSSPALLTSNVGNYALNSGSVAFTSGSASNYAIIYVNATLGVTVRPITITPTNLSRIYGDANPTNGSFTISTGSLANADALASSVAVVSPATLASNVGSYMLTPSSAAFSNGTSSNYAITYADGSLAVIPAALTFTADPTTRMYGDINPAFTGSIAGFKNGDLLATATTGTMVFTSPAGITANAGGQAINGSGLTANNGNYTFSQAAGNATVLTITPRPLTVTAVDFNRFYGDANPTTMAVTSSGLVNGDTIANAGASTSATQGSNAGTYSVTPSGTSFSTGLASNYTIGYISGFLTITQRPLTITPITQGRIYGEANPLYGTVTASNLANGDTLGVSSMTSSATPLSNVGTYDLLTSSAAFTQGSSSNYSITYAPGSLTVAPRPITITSNTQTKVYGAADPTLTYQTEGQSSGRGLLTGQTLSGGLTRALGETVAGGPYAISIGSLASNSNYTIGFVGSSLTISPATLTYVATSTTANSSASIPDLLGNVTGFQRGDTLSTATSGNVLWTTAAGPSSGPGTYAIDGSGLTANSGNYVFEQSAGNASALTIIAGTSSLPKPVIPGIAPTNSGLPGGDSLLAGTSTGVLSSFVSGTDSILGALVENIPTSFFISDPDEAGSLTLYGAQLPGSGAHGSGLVSFTSERNTAIMLMPPMPSEATGSERPPTNSKISAYLNTGKHELLVGTFLINEDVNFLSATPIEDLPDARIASTAAARKAFFTLKTASSSPVEVEVSLSDDGLLVVKVPVAFIEERGIKCAILAGVMAARQGLQAEIGSIRVVRIILPR